MQIYILRHGIAEDAGPGQSDSERALTSEGKKKLRNVLRAAHEAGVTPALILTSPLKRAVQTAELAAEILASLDGRLAKMKWPKSIDFAGQLPRDPGGKLLKRRLREPYWAERTTAIG